MTELRADHTSPDFLQPGILQQRKTVDPHLQKQARKEGKSKVSFFKLKKNQNSFM
jgi:hypothetical protein